MWPARSQWRVLFYLLVLGIAGCNNGCSGIAAADPASISYSLHWTPEPLAYCCDKSQPVPPGGILVGTACVSLISDVTSVLDSVYMRLSNNGKTFVRATQFGTDADVFEVKQGQPACLEIYALVCVDEINAEFEASAYLPDDPLYESDFQYSTLTIRLECPPPVDPIIYETCSEAGDERFVLNDLLVDFADDVIELATAGGTEGCRICTLGGPVVREPDAFGDYFGCAYLPEVPGAPMLSGAAAVAAPEAMCFYGIGIVGVTSWDEAAGIFGLYGIDGFGRNWTDVAASGDPDATNHFLAVDFLNRRVASIVPQSGFWALQTFTDVVAASKLDPTWGFPVTVFREERTGDICLALAPTQTTPGNFVVASMGGDDVADSCQLIGPTGKFPREMAGLNGIYGVACQAENILSLFRKTATGYEKIKDEVVGDGPIGLATFPLANGNVAFLTTGSRDDTWSVTEVDPTTGTVVGTTTKPVPTGIDEPTDIQVNSAGDVYILGKTSRNIARIPGALQ